MRLGPNNVIRLLCVSIILATIASSILPWWTISKTYQYDDSQVVAENRFSFLGMEVYQHGEDPGGWFSPSSEYNEDRWFTEYGSVNIDDYGLNATENTMVVGRNMNIAIFTIATILLLSTFTLMPKRRVRLMAIILSILILVQLMIFLTMMNHAIKYDDHLQGHNVDGLIGDDELDDGDEVSWYLDGGFFFSVLSSVISVILYLLINRNYNENKVPPIEIRRGVMIILLSISLGLMFATFFSPLWTAEERFISDEFGLSEERASWRYDGLWIATQSNVFNGDPDFDDRDLGHWEHLDPEQDEHIFDVTYQKEEACLETISQIAVGSMLLLLLTIIAISISSNFRTIGYILPALLILAVGVTTAMPLYFMHTYPDAMEADMVEDYINSSSPIPNGSEPSIIHGFSGSAKGPESDTIHDLRYEWGPDIGWIFAVYSALLSWLTLAILVIHKFKFRMLIIALAVIILIVPQATASSILVDYESEREIGIPDEYRIKQIEGGYAIIYRHNPEDSEKESTIQILSLENGAIVKSINSNDVYPLDWDGRYLVYTDTEPFGRYDSWENSFVYIYDLNNDSTNNLTYTIRDIIEWNDTSILEIEELLLDYPYIIMNLDYRLEDYGKWVHSRTLIFNITSNSHHWSNISLDLEDGRDTIVVYQDKLILSDIKGNYGDGTLNLTLYNFITNESVILFTWNYSGWYISSPNLALNDDNLALVVPDRISDSWHYHLIYLDLKSNETIMIRSVSRRFMTGPVIYEDQVYLVSFNWSIDSYMIYKFDLQSHIMRNVPIHPLAPDSTVDVGGIYDFDIHDGELHYHYEFTWLRPTHFFLIAPTVDYMLSHYDSHLLALNISYDTDNDSIPDLDDDDIDNDGIQNFNDKYPYRQDHPKPPDPVEDKSDQLLMILLTPFIITAVILTIIVKKYRLQFLD